MRSRMSAACFAIRACVSGVDSETSGSVDCLRCGVTISATRGTATCACISTVRLFGRASRPGLPCLRAAVFAYLFQISIAKVLFVGFVAEHAEMLLQITAVLGQFRRGG